MSAHTPGPWSVVVEKGREAEPCIMVGELYVATCHDMEPSTRSNAALVAAAPDLLAACEELADCARWRCRCSIAEIESGHHVDCWKPQAEDAAERARAAITKSRGGK